MIDPDIAALYDVPADQLDTIDPECIELVTRGERLCHCGKPAQGLPSHYPDVCTQWPICERKPT